MHKVCRIRDLDLRARLSPGERWAAYARDLDRLMDGSIGGVLGVSHDSSQARAAA